MKKVLGLAAFWIACVPALFAQSDRGTITGTISDPAGAVITNAVIIAINTDNGSQYNTVSTATGNYTLPQLPVGPYNLEVTSPGFGKLTQKGIRIQVAQTARIDVIMQLTSTAESVTITADAALLKTESAEQSHNITSDQMNNLPLNFAGVGPGNMRTPYAFLQLTPGGNIAPNGNSFNIRVNGSPSNTLAIRVEGQESNPTLQPGSPHQIQPSVEALQEVSVQTSNYSAEYGQVAGGLFNLTTKSGTNQLHGSAYEYFVNEALNAGLPYTNDGSGGRILPRTRKHDFGGSLGGPVIIPKLYNGRDRTFFFFNYEMYRHREIFTGTYQTIPTEAFRRGDFSSILTTRAPLGTDLIGRPILENTIYDPATARLVNGQVVTDPFPGNIIPSNRFDPVAVKIQSFIPLPTRGGNVQNWLQAYPNKRTQDIPSIKIDHNFSQSSKMSFFWTRYRTDHLSGSDGLPIPLTAQRYIQIRSHTLRMNYDQTISPTVLLHLGAGILRQGNPDKGLPEVIGYDAYGLLGLTGGAVNGFPRLEGLNSNFGGSQPNLGPTNFNQYATEKPTFVASLTWVKNSHTYKFGGEFRIDTYSDRNTRQGTGVYRFNAAETALPASTTTNIGGGIIGFPYASFLLGRVNSATVAGSQDPQLRKNSLSLFAQDTWKVTRRLTLDYGLRWDYQQAPRELHNRTSVFDPNIANPSAGGLLGAVGYEGYGPGRCNCRLTKTYPWAFGPRLGAAYQIDNKTVLRAGWGITYGTTANFNFITNTPMIGVGFNSLNFTAPAFGEPATTLQQGLVYDRSLLTNASYDPGLRPSPGQTDSPPFLLDENGGRPARIAQWNISLQRELTNNLVVEAAYVGNRGAWFASNGLVNLNGLSEERVRAFGLDITNPADQTLLRSRIDSPLAQSKGFRPPYAGYPGGRTVAESIRPYPQFGTIDVRYAPLGNTWYDSLQVKVTKRYSHGLDMSVAFTWQKELTRGAENQDGGSGQVNDVFNRDTLKYISQFSQPFVFVTGFNYEVPRPAGNRIISNIVGGWTIGGILKYSSGLPIRVPQANSNLNTLLLRANTGTAISFANRVPGEPLFTNGNDLNCGCFNPVTDFVLNPKAWADPAQGQFGTSAAYYNDYRYARRPDEQMSVGRTFRFKERFSFHVRGEFFNILNRTYLNNPDSTNFAASQLSNSTGTVSGFGRINTASLFAQPRNGQLVGRIQW